MSCRFSLGTVRFPDSIVHFHSYIRYLLYYTGRQWMLSIMESVVHFSSSNMALACSRCLPFQILTAAYLAPHLHRDNNLD